MLIEVFIMSPFSLVVQITVFVELNQMTESEKVHISILLLERRVLAVTQDQYRISAG